MRGSVETLARYYPELQDRSYDTVMALCHARYSTNTVSNFERAQPFAMLGHNGEINTISRFRQEGLSSWVSTCPKMDRIPRMLTARFGKPVCGIWLEHYGGDGNYLPAFS